MEAVETIVLREPWEIGPRLTELGLGLEGLLNTARIGMAEGANATDFHCANAPGTFRYQFGTWALRREFVGKDWRVDRSEGVEGIWNDKLRVRIVFCNVDVSCQERGPKPRSDKGTGAERVCHPNLFGFLPQYAPRQEAGEATYYLMVDEAGAVELTRPVASGKTFSHYIERLWLSFGGDDLEGKKLPLDEDDAVNDFDPLVARR